jgi:hypothetical protein
MKRFTPPRKLANGQSDSEESDYSDSEYSYSDSYSSVSYFTYTDDIKKATTLYLGGILSHVPYLKLMNMTGLTLID